jgi:hypothetical protein
MYVVAGTEDQPAILVWASHDSINQAALVAVPDEGAAPSSSPGPSVSGSPAKATPKPSKQP